MQVLINIKDEAYEKVMYLLSNLKDDVSIQEINLDETEYLLKSKNNKKHLLDAIENIKDGDNLETININEL